ncbi:UDP-glucose 4-epimerase GalE [Lysobacter hankyongensis]|uniref:UDP-glucose 4-epimerase n=1 Tax=Lysobacter hankyongensis TaxID=1176535 RepID=A0ABP9AIJ4_9GAMM
MRILVCGGAGYIGSHTCVVLAERGHEVVIADNFSNSAPAVLDRIARLIGRAPEAHRIDVRDADALARLFAADRSDAASFDAVIHFAALKSVGESCVRPLEYFDNNVSGTIALLRAMRAAGVGRLVFSSSATVYGAPSSLPIDESAPLSVTNPYGRTKLIVEQILEDACAADPGWRAISLRYFNPVGAHPSGLIGEAPSGVPNNLMPYICQVAVGLRERLQVYGGDWPTVDGTGVRDYIHVMDLAHAHAHAIEALGRISDPLHGHRTINLGVGRGISVLELVRAFEAASGRAIPYEIVGRRPGDVAEVYADPRLADTLLGWRAERDVDAMCRDAWRWQSMNPAGYAAG